MAHFETIYGAGTCYENVVVHPHQVALWCHAFGVPTLDGLFDIMPAVDAIARIDEAIARINVGNPELRAALDDLDSLGLRGNRKLFEQMRTTLANHSDATISGVVEDA